MKIEDLQRLQELQLDYIGCLDIQIETRGDHQLTMFTVTNYPYAGKLYIHKLSWFEDNSEEFEKIEEEIKLMKKKKINE